MTIVFKFYKEDSDTEESLRQELQAYQDGMLYPDSNVMLNITLEHRFIVFTHQTVEDGCYRHYSLCWLWRNRHSECFYVEN